METKHCPVCKALFARTYGTVGQWEARICCSRSCATVLQHARKRASAPTKPCSVCGLPFPRNLKYSEDQWNRAQFCSRECQYASKTLERPYCSCGCGKRVVKPHHRYLRGHDIGHRSYPSRRKVVKFDGRRWYVFDRKGKKVYWARIVLADKLGRRLRPGEIAHHVNGDNTDDRPENIELKASHSEHMREHYAKGDIHPVDWRDRWCRE